MDHCTVSLSMTSLLVNIVRAVPYGQRRPVRKPGFGPGPENATDGVMSGVRLGSGAREDCKGQAHHASPTTQGYSGLLYTPLH